MQTDVVQILQRELGRRCQVNPRYSMRAFARALGVSPANLSLVLSRKRPPSRRTVERILARLELKPLERETVAQSQALLKPQEPEQENVSLETIERVSNWVSYAILSLVRTRGFKPDARWAAQRLGVSVHEIRASVDALSAVGLLEVSSSGKGQTWKRSKASLRLNNQVTTAIVRSFHRQLLEKAVASMENDPMDAREISSITFAMSPDKMKMAKEEIRKFRLRMSELFEEPQVSTEVYNMTVQLVPVTKTAREPVAKGE